MSAMEESETTSGHGLQKDLLTNSHYFDSRTGICRLQAAFVGGQWVTAVNGNTITVTDPADGQVLGSVTALGVAETQAAIDAAALALPAWKALLPQQRADILTRWYDLILEHREDLALLMTAEQGKPLNDARGEIDYAASFIQWFAEEGKRLNGATISSHLPNRKLSVQREALGVVAAITPWNFPSAMITRKAAAALAAGCTVVAVPSCETPFSALALAELAEQAGFPSGVFSVLTGDPATLVGELCREPRVRGLSFTGSTEIGQLLMQQCAPTIKRLCLELGGHAPFIVFDDVDVKTAVAAAIKAKFETGGQDCLAANRIFIDQKIYPQFVKQFTQSANALIVGSGFEPDTDIGPLMNANAINKCLQQVNDALQLGANMTTPTRNTRADGLFLKPIVLSDVTAEMQIYQQETFGPVAALIPFADEQDVIKQANDSEYGLMAYVYTRDISRAWRIADQLEYGMVGINSIKVTGPPIPFGGIKQSGLGREGGSAGIEEFTELKYVCLEV
jgi:aspartate-semialdehyde dehydrogenase